MMRLLLALSFCCGVVFAGAVDFEDVTEPLFGGVLSRGGGVTWADLDLDGYPDLIVNGKIYRNCCGRGFQEVTPSGWKQHGPAIVADFNGDGRPDIFFAATYAYFVGTGRFGFQTRPLPPLKERRSLGACAADFDGDGWVDIYYSGYEDWQRNKSYPDYVLKNRRGAFTVSWQSGRLETMRCHGGVTACDFNEDGHQEVYVSNYRLQPNQLWFDLGTGTPENKARMLGVAGGERRNAMFTNDLGVTYFSSGHTIGSVWGDFDGDGLFDLFVGNFSHPPAYQDRPQFLRNMGRREGWIFEDKSRRARLRWQESYAGAAAGDYNNDGRLDLMFTTVYAGDRGVLLRNEGDWRFVEATKTIDCVQTYQAAWADFDRDGKLDLFTNGRLYRNCGRGGRHVQVVLRGQKPNSMAIGAVVRLDGDGLTQVRQVEAGTGCGCQNDATLHFGVGAVRKDTAYRLAIHWPSGRCEEHRVQAGHRYVFKE